MHLIYTVYMFGPRPSGEPSVSDLPSTFVRSHRWTLSRGPTEIFVRF